MKPPIVGHQENINSESDTCETFCKAPCSGLSLQCDDFPSNDPSFDVCGSSRKPF